MREVEHASSLLLSLALLAATACGGGSPSEPNPSAGSSNIIIDDPQGLFSAHHAMIRELLEQTMARASAELAVGQASVSITVSSDPSRAIPGYGLGGYALNGVTMEIVIDPSFPALGDVLPERLPPVAAHELHHNVRWRGPGYGTTLLENMVSEGLADHFAIELLGGSIRPWSNAFPRDQTDDYLARALPELDSTTFDFRAWFFGIGSELPPWVGYTLGYRLVEGYKAANPGRSAASLVDTSAEAFRPD